ncbi:MFS transporter [Rhodococcus sp. ABRD24]|uniref:MFS transporter n=1 Tax=Rhodococcus sp. ABRD24 TaxID=2507582 RepID=UPI00103B374A|nr:MFS transporter [Rhodococcus sp. ABRD24]QBJ95230.1 MFS transporter [Rhodococcus sp. ABRD24]
MANSMMSPANTDTKLPKEIWVLVVSAFIVAVGFGIVAPALPQFARSFDVGYTAASAVISAFALMRLLFAPMSGRLVQRLGERPTYLTGLIITAMSTGACAFADSYWQLLVFRGLGGIGSTMFTVSALGLLIRMSPPGGRGRVSGVYSAAFLIGTITGPLFGGALVRFGLRVPFVIYAVALLIAAAVVYFALRKSHLAEPQGDSELRMMTLREGLRSPMFRATLGSNFVSGWVIFGVRIALVPLFVVAALDGDETTAAIALTVFALGNASVLIKSGPMSDRIGRRPFVLLGLALSGLSTIGMGFADNVIVFYIATAVCGIGSGVMGPAQQAAVADVVGSKARGGPLLAAFQMVNDVGAFAGPLVAGYLAQQWSFGVAWAVTGAIMLLPMISWFFVPKGRAVDDTAVDAGSAGNADADEHAGKTCGSDGDRT